MGSSDCALLRERGVGARLFVNDIPVARPSRLRRVQRPRAPSGMVPGSRATFSAWARSMVLRSPFASSTTTFAGRRRGGERLVDEIDRARAECDWLADWNDVRPHPSARRPRRLIAARAGGGQRAIPTPRARDARLLSRDPVATHCPDVTTSATNIRWRMSTPSPCSARVRFASCTSAARARRRRGTFSKTESVVVSGPGSTPSIHDPFQQLSRCTRTPPSPSGLARRGCP